jgi:hypothetical protein
MRMVAAGERVGLTTGGLIKIDDIPAAIAIAIPFLGGLTAMFGFVPLPTPLLATVIVVVLGCVLATEAAKAWYFRFEKST